MGGALASTPMPGRRAAPSASARYPPTYWLRRSGASPQCMLRGICTGARPRTPHPPAAAASDASAAMSAMDGHCSAHGSAVVH